MLESTEVFDHSDCGLPIAVQIDRLERQLNERFDVRFDVGNVDLYSLEGTERDEALDAVVAGEPSPFVLVGGHLVCTGNVDPQAVIACIARVTHT